MSKIDKAATLAAHPSSRYRGGVTRLAGTKKGAPMRTRIVTLGVLAAVVAIGLFGIPLAVAVGQDAVANARSELQRAAESVADIVRRDLANDSDTVPPAELLRAAAGAELAVYDNDGDLVAGRGADAGDQLVQEALHGRVSSEERFGQLVVAVPVTDDDHLIGAVRLARSSDAVNRKVGLTWLAMAGLGCIAVGAVWLIARRQARHLAGPLETLSGTAQRLGEGDFSVRAEPVHVPEIDAVGSALNITAARLDDLLARERAFSADASHQLGTPLAGLRLRLEAALDEPESQLREAVTAGIADVDRLENIIDELLALARDARDSGPLDLPAMLAELEPDWRARLDARGRQLQVVIDSRAPRGVASAAAVRQIFTVLLDNAATHGSGAVTVTIRNAAGALAIDVADQGPRIGAPEAELFARRSRSAAGHGIGLALARRLAEAEGGRLRLTHQAPPTFSLLLPAERAPAGRESDSPPSPHPVRPISASSPTEDRRGHEPAEVTSSMPAAGSRSTRRQ